jgi:hypothetical protein
VDTALRYLRLTLGGVGVPTVVVGAAYLPTAVTDFTARTVRARLRNQAGEAVENLELGEPMALDVVLEATRDLAAPSFVINVLNEDGMVVFGLKRELPSAVPAGGRMRLEGTIVNQLATGRYFLDCWVRDDREAGRMAVQGLRLLQFVVFGTEPRFGIFSAQADVQPLLEAAE